MNAVALANTTSKPLIQKWRYEDAFSRNLGLIGPKEQTRLKNSCVAIAGMGGVGGIHLATLARLGVGHFRIADPDTFEVANSNRQYGAEVETLGLSKVRVMAEKARAINPEIEIEVFDEAVNDGNVDSFLSGADILVDGVDFFSFNGREILFREARRRGIWGVTAGPIGFSTAWLTFEPQGMTFGDYFDIRENMDLLDWVATFAVGLAPCATHLPYLDLSQVDSTNGRAPSVGAACHLASGVVAAEVVKILLGRGDVRPAPCYAQFDAYRCVLRRGRLPWGNRGPLQRLKRRLLKRRLVQLYNGKPVLRFSPTSAVRGVKKFFSRFHDT